MSKLISFADFPIPAHGNSYVPAVQIKNLGDRFACMSGDEQDPSVRRRPRKESERYKLLSNSACIPL